MFILHLPFQLYVHQSEPLQAFSFVLNEEFLQNVEYVTSVIFALFTTKKNIRNNLYLHLSEIHKWEVNTISFK